MRRAGTAVAPARARIASVWPLAETRAYPKGRFCGAVSAKPLKTLVQENQRSGAIFGLTEQEPTSPMVARPLADEGKLGQPISFRLASSEVDPIGWTGIGVT
jgi:hypothetical protein